MVNKKGKGAKTKGSKPPVKKPQQENTKDLTQQSPQERVTLVRPLWETLEQGERVKLLSIDLDSVRSRAKQLAEAARQQAVADAPEGEPLDPALLELEPSIEDVFEEGIKRLKEKGTWKLWQWPADNSALYDAESFRQHVTEKHIREELRRLLPRDEGRAIEKPAEAGFRQRMLDLLSKVQQSTNANSLRPTVMGASGEDGAARPYRRRGDPGSHLRDANIELLSVLLEALAKENDHLYHSLLTPITTYVMEILPEGHRETTKLELSFEDLENLLPDDVSRIVEWLTEKVDALSTKLKPEPKEEDEEEEENMGDVDLWSLNEDTSSLAVNAKWLQHLQDRLLGEDGHPRRAKPGEDPGHNGLVLEWVYGSIVSTAEKARDGAKRCLGMQPPTAADAHMLLVRALEEHLSWETRAKQCKDLLSEMLKSRLEAAELTRQGYDLRPQPKRDLPGMGGEASQVSPLMLEDGPSSLAMAAAAESKPLPDEVILFMLRREALLTRAKLHFLVFEHLTQEKELRILKQALRQGEPEFERLKRELDEVKHQPRGMEGAYRSAAEMERHRHQLEVQTAFREQGARLQATYDKKQKAEYDMAKRETEIKQLQGWKGTVENLVDKFQELIAFRNERTLAASSAGAEGGTLRDLNEAEEDLEAASGSLTPQQYIQLTKMRNHFSKDVRKQLYGDADDRTFFDNLKTALKAIERRLEDSSVALQHLEMQLINVACDDPGAIIGTQLALPLLQERLDQRGLEYAAQRAKLAEDEVLRMELLAAEREAAERERKKAAKAKKNERAKSEKERLAAERQAKEAAERVARQEAERERAVRDEEERRKRVEAVEAMRKAEEAAMELRRKELLSDENGYWRQRMIMEERLSGMAAGTGASDRNVTAAASSPDLSEEQDRHRSSSPEDARFGGDDDEGFITDNRRRRHKDTRDQDDEVAAPAPAPAQPAAGQGSGAGGRAHMRSGSRDRMGPREGVPQRERGEHHPQHPQRERDSRRHHGPGGTSMQRSGSREAGGRQGSYSSGGGQQVPRPPSAPPAAAAPSTAGPLGPVARTEPQPQAVESAEAAAPATAPVAEPATATAASTTPAAEVAEQPAAPASVSPPPAAAREAEAGAASPAASGALPSPSAASVPEDAILFGDIAVIPVAAGSGSTATPAKLAAQPVITPTPIPVPPTESASQEASQGSADSQQAAAPSTSGAQAPQPQQPRPQQLGAAAAPGMAAPAQVPHPAQLQLQQQQPGQVPSGASMPLPSQQGQGPAPLGTLPTGQVVHPIGHLPPGGLPGPLPGMVPPMMAHMASGGPGGPPGAGPPRPQGPASGPPPPYIHVNGGIPVPIPAPGGPMPPMGSVLSKQMAGQQMPPPPPGPVLVPIGVPPGSRPPMPGPGMPSGPPPPPGVAGPPPAQQQPAGPMARPPGPMPGMPGPPGAPAGLLQVPHPQGPGQQQHGQPSGVPPGAGPRGPPGPQGQPQVMISPMQFPGPMAGGAMALPHGQPPNGPMGHVPPHLYVFPPGTPGMVPPPGAPGQLQPHPHPHLLQMMPPGMPMPMGPPPQMHMQPPPQQPHQQAAGQAPPGLSPSSQPPPPPKSPSATTSATKPGSTLNVNARSFVPAGKAAASATAGASAAAGQQAQPQAQSPASSQPQSQQQHASQRPYQRQGSGGLMDGAGGAGPGPQQGHPAPGAYPRVGPAGPFTGPGQPPAPGGGQYGNRRDRRDGARGGPGGSGAGPRKGAGVGPAGPHAVMQPAVDMSGGPGMPMPLHHHPAGPPPMPMMGPAGPVMMVMGPAGPMQVSMHAPSHVSHASGMESAEGGAAGPLDRPDSGAEDGSRPAAVDHPPGAPPAAGMPGGPPPHPAPPLPGPGPGPGPGLQHPGLAPPPPGMAPPGGRMMLTWQPGMPGPVQVPMMPVMPMAPMGMPMHMLQAAGGPPHGPNDGHVQKNGSAAESVRAPHSAGGDDSAAGASATAQNTQSKDGDPAEAAGEDGRPQSSPSAREASPDDMEQRTVAAAVGPPAEPTGPHEKPLAARPAPDDATTVTSTAYSAIGAVQQQQRQQHPRAGAAGSSPSGLPGRVGSSGPAGPSPVPASAPSWSSVAARREGSATSSNSGQSLDPFPSLVPSATSTTSAAGASDAVAATAPPHPGPAAGSSWKAKLQQNVGTAASATVIANGGGGAGAQKSPAALPNGVPGGGSPPVVVRGSSPRGTMNGSVSIASSLSDSGIANSSGVSSNGGISGAAAAGMAAPTPQRPPGNRPAGSALLTGAPTQLAGSLSLPSSDSGSGNSHIMYHTGVSGQSRRLQLVRGLQNLGGQHNCFLNVIIQSLWHLRSFREAVLQLNVEDVATRGAVAADVTVLRALVGVFGAMAAPPAQPATASSSPWWIVSPLQLREALSVLETGQAVVRLDLSEMHDAFEVLLVLLTCMHRAEAGSCATQGQDPQLPRRVRVRDIAAATCGSHANTPAAVAAMANGHHPPQAMAPTGYAAVVAAGGGRPGGKATVPADSAAAVPCTAAHSLFGLEVQVPCAAEEDGNSCCSNGSAGGGGLKDRQQQQQQQQQAYRSRRDSTGGSGALPVEPTAAAALTAVPTATASVQLLPHPAAGRSAADDPTAAEVEVYTKYFHLVHAQSLRKAFAALDGSDSGAFFEDVLCAAEAAGAGTSAGPLVLPVVNGRRPAGGGGGAAGLANGHAHHHAAHGWAPGATAAAHPLATLLRFPTVFTLALVWESLQAPPEALRGTLEALGSRVDLALLFRCSGPAPGMHPPSAPCELRSVICYAGHHYLVFALSEELGLWLMIDDASIQLVGHWSDVVKAMLAKRLQPSLLFYEAVERGRQSPPQIQPLASVASA